MHPAAQVQAQEHGLGAQVTQPGGGRRRQIEGDDVVAAQGVTQYILGLDLVLGVGEAHHQVIRLSVIALIRDTVLLQHIHHRLFGGVIDYDPGVGGGYLYHRHIAIEIGQGVKHPQDNKHNNRQIFP